MIKRIQPTPNKQPNVLTTIVESFGVILFLIILSLDYDALFVSVGW